jgi:hypothetical protein
MRSGGSKCISAVVNLAGTSREGVDPLMLHPCDDDSDGLAKPDAMPEEPTASSRRHLSRSPDECQPYRPLEVCRTSLLSVYGKVYSWHSFLGHMISRQVERDKPAHPRLAPSPAMKATPFPPAYVVRPSAPSSVSSSSARLSCSLGTR